MHKSHTSLIEGPIWKGMLMFALPIFLGQVFQQFYNTFDSWVVGKYIGENALAAVSSSSSLIFMLIGFFSGVAMGAGVIIARYFGARDYAAMEKAIHTDVAFGLTAGAFLTVLGVTFTPTILRWMGTPSEVLPQSITYFRYYFCGAIFSVMYNIFVGILHAVGDSKHPLYYLIFSTFVNIALDLLFVAVLQLGVGAAAFATTISQGISALLCCIHLLRAEGPYRLHIRRIRFDLPSLRTIIRLGLPSGVQNSVIAFANLVVQSNINSFGAAAMAGCGSYSKIEGFAFLPITCFSQALSTFVGQNLGAHNYERVKKGVGFGIACSCLFNEAKALAHGCGFRHPAYAGHLPVLLSAGLLPLHGGHFPGCGKKYRPHADHAHLLVSDPGDLHYRHHFLHQPAGGGVLGLSHHLDPQQYRIFDLFPEGRLDPQLRPYGAE